MTLTQFPTKTCDFLQLLQNNPDHSQDSEQCCIVTSCHSLLLPSLDQMKDMKKKLVLLFDPLDEPPDELFALNAVSTFGDMLVFSFNLAL
ncbi:hypothetical protein HanIR_Chr08g0376351 [Helianthus annuus]|nr:hypothetical protein HanIR_Chr08g0376351 [Helianthus annuus]